MLLFNLAVLKHLYEFFVSCYPRLLDLSGTNGNSASGTAGSIGGISSAVVRVCSGRRELGISDESDVGVTGVAKPGKIGRQYLFLSCIPLQLQR